MGAGRDASEPAERNDLPLTVFTQVFSVLQNAVIFSTSPESRQAFVRNPLSVGAHRRYHGSTSTPDRSARRQGDEGPAPDVGVSPGPPRPDGAYRVAPSGTDAGAGVPAQELLGRENDSR